MSPSNENLVQFVPRPRLQKGNMFFETGSNSASESQLAYCPVLHHVTLQCPANFLHFLQSENIGSPDGDPVIEIEITCFNSNRLVLI